MEGANGPVQMQRYSRDVPVSSLSSGSSEEPPWKHWEEKEKQEGVERRGKRQKKLTATSITHLSKGNRIMLFLGLYTLNVQLSNTIKEITSLFNRRPTKGYAYRSGICPVVALLEEDWKCSPIHYSHSVNMKEKSGSNPFISQGLTRDLKSVVASMYILSPVKNTAVPGKSVTCIHQCGFFMHVEVGIYIIISCELLKNLVFTGFSHIDLIDLDTIDVSNLNRQFLFQKKHVGRSKAQVAKESVLQFYPKANIIAYHDSIMNPDYNVEFFRQFILVLNALDNRAARNHVNRMCLAADVPLIESGTAGYLGQVTTIKKGVTECYECHPKPTQRTFPGCTIRNTPSEPIHCFVWAKYLFNQLFGEEDADQEVSPDRADPEASWEPMEAEARARASNEDGDIKRISTKEWAKSTGYDPVKLFTKLFKDDIRYLLTMDKLWRKRKPPVPLDWAEVQSQGEETNATD
ncbi:hypothetical protein GH733_001907 [Mirounga leonina]|nr:hypothetical protein GH733_001907 [Mirounga leonina]